MRWITVLAVVAVVFMFFGGWLYFRDTGDTSEVILDKNKVQQDTEAAAETGKRALQKTAEGMKNLGAEVEDAFSQEPSEEGERRPVDDGERRPVDDEVPDERPALP